MNRVRNIAVVSKEGITNTTTSMVQGVIYPPYTPGTNPPSAGTVINANLTQSKIASTLQVFQNDYNSRIDSSASLIDPENGISGVSLPITASIGISINNKQNKSFYFNGDINGTSVYQSIPLPQSDQNEVKQYIYTKGVLIILNTNNKIYYCRNCNIHMGQVVWTTLVLPANVNSLDKKKIGYDFTNNILFILAYNGSIYYCNSMTTSTPTCSLLTPPLDEASFLDFDVISGKIGILGGYTQFLYLADYSSATIRNPQWRLIDNSTTVSTVTLNLKGILVKDTGGFPYFCQYPCLLKGGNKWELMSDSIADGISGNANLLSIIKNNNIYTSNKPYNKDNLKKLNDIGVHSAKIIDYIYPSIPLETPKFTNLQAVNLNTNSTKIDNYTTSINNLLTNIQSNINSFNTKQQEFQTYLTRQITQRDKYINHINRGYDCIDKLINSTNRTRNQPQCVSYFRNQPAYKAELLAFENNEKALIVAERVAATTQTSAPTQTPDPYSEFFTNTKTNTNPNQNSWPEYFTNYSDKSADEMLDKLGNVKILKFDLLEQGEDIIAVME
jgi:hypothetical protein